MTAVPFVPEDILITGADDFLAKYLYESFKSCYGGKLSDKNLRIWMLGTGDRAGVKVDLASGTFEMPCVPQVVVHSDATGMDDGTLTVDRALTMAGNLVKALDGAGKPSVLIYVSSVAVYGLSSGENVDESFPCAPVTEYGRAKLEVERFLEQWCGHNGVRMVIARPAMVVGTGMQGALRCLVNRIYRGTYRHVTGNESCVSVVHATDLADVIARLACHSGKFNVTDGAHTTRHDIVEALAWRLDHKRVYSLSLSKARVLARIGDYLPITGFSSASLDAELATLTFDGGAARCLTGVPEVNVCNYLRNHKYDETSL